MTMALLAGVYAVVGKLSLMLATLHPSASPVWPPTGLAIAALLLLGRKYWPAILAGAFFVNVTTEGSLATSLGIASGNTLEAVVGSFLAERFAGGVRAFERVNGVLLFVFLVALWSPIVSATLGVLTLILGGFAAIVAAPSIWLTWWLGDVVGALTVTPLIVLWSQDCSLSLNRQKTFEGIGVLLFLVLLGGVIFGTSYYAFPYFTLLPILWAAIRFGPRETVTVVAALASIAVAGTLLGTGSFAGFESNTSLLYLQGFVAVVAFMGMSLAAALQERKALEESLEQKVEERTRQLARLREREREFMSLASHQLRTPLTGIRWSLSRLERVLEGRVHPEEESLVREGKRALVQLSQTIDTMLLIARLEAGHSVLRTSTISLCAFLSDAASPFQAACAKKKIVLSIECHEELTLETDEAFLREILRTLIHNAIQYTPEGGQITVRATRKADTIAVEVEDNGCGIPKNQHSRIFGKFFRADNVVAKDIKGSGLGLYLVSLLTTHIGGSISFSSEEGKGTVFIVTLPLRLHVPTSPYAERPRR